MNAKLTDHKKLKIISHRFYSMEKGTTNKPEKIYPTSPENRQRIWGILLGKNPIELLEGLKRGKISPRIFCICLTTKGVVSRESILKMLIGERENGGISREVFCQCATIFLQAGILKKSDILKIIAGNHYAVNEAGEVITGKEAALCRRKENDIPLFLKTPPPKGAEKKK